MAFCLSQVEGHHDGVVASYFIIVRVASEDLRRQRRAGQTQPSIPADQITWLFGTTLIPQGSFLILKRLMIVLGFRYLLHTTTVCGLSMAPQSAILTVPAVRFGIFPPFFDDLGGSLASMALGQWTPTYLYSTFHYNSTVQYLL